MKRNSKDQKKLNVNVEKVREMTPVSDDKLRNVAGGQPQTSHTTYA